MENKILQWRDSELHEPDLVVDSRNIVAKKQHLRSIEDLCNRSLGLNLKELTLLVNFIKKIDRKIHIYGVGIELGAGSGFLSSEFLSQNIDIDKIYAIEISKEHVELIIPKVMRDRLSEDIYPKLVPVIGSFDEIQLEDNSVDFAFEIHSLHHSDNLETTLKEVCRVLKPGGKLICFDRSHPDFTTDYDIKKMLDLEYDQDSLFKIGFPKGTILTRRGNGEHEYRVGEWVAMFERNGLNVLEVEHIGNKFSSNKFFRGLVSKIPYSIRILVLKHFLYFLSPHKREVILSKDLVSRVGELQYEIAKLFQPKWKKFTRPYSIFICEKI